MTNIPPEAVGLRLARIDRERLILCEAICFEAGLSGVSSVLRRAAISGTVEVGAKIENHFADVLDAKGNMIETVSLDRHSYSALKNRWMRCKVQQRHIPDSW